MNIEEKVRKLVESTITDNNYVLDNIQYLKENGQYFLRISIDKNGTIDLEDCVKVSNLINPILDKENPIDDSYILDVCSKEVD